MREFEQTGYQDAGLSVAELESGDCFENYTESLSDGASMRRGTEPLKTADFWWCERAPDGEITYLGRASLCHHPLPGEWNMAIAIRPSRRGKGHANALLPVITTIAQSHGINRICLICDD